MNYYETELLLDLYLLFHYGSDKDQLPFSKGPKDSLDFPLRCVTECLDRKALPPHAKGLDLGCAVGRSSFELARYCESVTGIDNSQPFIFAAKQIQTTGHCDYFLREEGIQRVKRRAQLPAGIDPKRVDFQCCDVMDLSFKPIAYHVVLAANLLCRLPDPQTFLKLLPKLVLPDGQLILISPYSWLEMFTPKVYWLGKEGETMLQTLQGIFKESFELQKAFDMPFLIRDHLRKYEWGIAQATIWKRK